jgi:DNA repair protein RecN (Recombination protein N)
MSGPPPGNGSDMLKQITIRNYALIDEMTVEFRPGLNILTGETGAGKSIILGAIGLILGERARTDIIRQGASSAVVEALFEVPDALIRKAADDTAGAPEWIGSGSLLLRREVFDTGRSRCFANDSPVTLNQMTRIGDVLVDLHGQHEHQALLRAERHLDYLDNSGVDAGLIRTVREVYRSVKNLHETHVSLTEREQRLKDQRELLEFQCREIQSADPKTGEEEALAREETVLRSAERISQAVRTIRETLYEGEGSVQERLSAARSLLGDLGAVDLSFRGWSEEIESAAIQLQDLLQRISSYADRIEYNPARLEEIRERLSLFGRLKKKYGGTMETVEARRHQAEADLARMESLKDEIERTAAELAAGKSNLAEACASLSTARRSAADRLERAVQASLAELGLPHGRFEIRMERRDDPRGWIRMDGAPVAVTPSGIDHVEFFITLNPGEPIKPLAQVASGGEVSRIMLALKSVLAESDEIPVLIFDEIDTGISGRIAHTVGRKLKGLGGKHQVLCITHLPQIASMGESHFSVSKRVTGDRTFTVIRRIDRDERALEIAKLIGGETVTETTMASARELLQPRTDASDG